MQRILIIDDEADFRTMAIQVLDAPGFEILQASDGAEGLRKFREASFDLVITDILMPEKDGIELIHSLRRESKEVKILAVSGGGRDGRSNYLKVAEDFGANGTLAKPFAANDLREKVAAILPGYHYGASSNS
jgi:DNA-binding response OmpR family regulator